MEPPKDGEYHHTLPLFVKHAEWCKKVNKPQILGGKSSVPVAIYSTHQMWCFSRAAAPSALARGYNGQAPENCSCFLPLSSLNWPLNAFFPEAGAHSVTGQAETDQGSRQKHTPYFSKTPFTVPSRFYLFVPTPSQSCAQHWTNTQLHCYRGKYCISFSHIKVTSWEASLPLKSTTLWTPDNIQNQELNTSSLSLPVCCIQHFS